MDGDANLVCLDGTMPKESAMNQWGQIWSEVERKTGVKFNLVASGCMENGIKQAGFTNIQAEDFLVSSMLSCSSRKAGIETERPKRLIQTTYTWLSGSNAHTISFFL